jgi:hypothetical protein
MGLIPLPEEYGTRMNELIVEFGGGGGGDRPKERRRQTLSEKLGDYGIIDMNLMNISMKCAWIKQWMIKVLAKIQVGILYGG